jgi:hypothetical protein
MVMLVLVLAMGMAAAVEVAKLVVAGVLKVVMAVLLMPVLPLKRPCVRCV